MRDWMDFQWGKNGTDLKCYDPVSQDELAPCKADNWSRTGARCRAHSAHGAPRHLLDQKRSSLPRYLVITGQAFVKCLGLRW